MVGSRIRDRGRGPEIEGTRFTVYNLLPYFFDPTATEDYICRVCELTPDQVAAARSYAFQNAVPVLEEHLKIEARMAEGNPPEVIEASNKAHNVFIAFKGWLEKEKRSMEELECQSASIKPGERLQSFREWFAEQQTAKPSVS